MHLNRLHQHWQHQDIIYDLIFEPKLKELEAVVRFWE